MRLVKIPQIIWSVWALFWIASFTLVIASWVVISAKLRVPQITLRRAARIWAKGFLWGAGCRVRVHGAAKLGTDLVCVYACNHSSALDIPVLLAILPENCRWVAKKELFQIPVFGPSLRAAGYTPIDRSNRRAALGSIEEALDNLRAGSSVIIFPEGTRSADGRLGEFKAGGFLLSLRSQKPVVPLAIIGSNRILPPHQFLLSPGIIEVEVGEPIFPQTNTALARGALVNLVRRRILELGHGKIESAPQ